MPNPREESVAEDVRCCDEPSCRRRQPLYLFQGGLTGRWMVATRWRHDGHRFVAIEKHELTVDQSADLTAAFAAYQAARSDGSQDA